MPERTGTAATSLMFRLQDFPDPGSDEMNLGPMTWQQRLPSEADLGALKIPDVPAASWLADVERRIQKSLLPQEHEAVNDGRWLSRGVANSAMTYFRHISDLMPVAPYLYSAGAGNLIAEFRGARGQLVTIVSDDLVQIVTVLEGTPAAHDPTPVWATDFGSLRRAIKKQLELVTKGRHGSKVDP